MITDVYSLAGISAEEIRWSEQQRTRAPHHRAHDVGLQDLGRLAGLLGVGTGSDLVGGFSLLAGESQQGPWVVSIPADLLAAVAALEEDQMDALAARWAHPDELSNVTTAGARAAYVRELWRFLRAHEGPFVLYIHQEVEK